MIPSLILIEVCFAVGCLIVPWSTSWNYQLMRNAHMRGRLRVPRRSALQEKNTQQTVPEVSEQVPLKAKPPEMKRGSIQPHRSQWPAPPAQATLADLRAHIATEWPSMIARWSAFAKSIIRQVVHRVTTLARNTFPFAFVPGRRQRSHGMTVESAKVTPLPAVAELADTAGSSLVAATTLLDEPAPRLNASADAEDAETVAATPPVIVAIASAPPLSESAPTAARNTTATTSPGIGKRKRRVLVIVSTVLAVIILFSAASGAIIALQGYQEYTSLKHDATDAINALSNIATSLGISGSHLPKQPVSAQQQTQIQSDLGRASHDLQVITAQLASPDLPLQIAIHDPAIALKLRSALLLSGIGIDAVRIAGLWMEPAIATLNAVTGIALLGGTATGSGLTTSDLDAMRVALEQTNAPLADIMAIVQSTPQSVLFAALDAKQQAKVLPILQLLPRIPALLDQVGQFLPVAGAMLGIGQPANYLIIAMDPSEMRASGGFQGNYAVLSVNGAQPGNLSLRDIYLVDNPQKFVCGQSPAAVPQQYATWWPFCPFGSRDANLSPDFPTSAQLTLQAFQALGGNVLTDAQGNITATQVPMTAMIAIQPTIIEQLLRITGSVTVGAPYNVAVTADNVQALIHYYQLTNAGRAVGGQASAGSTLSSANKRFTALLGRSLLASVKTLSRAQMLQYAQQLFADLATKEVQVYFTDPGAEAYFTNLNATAALYRGSDDALMMTVTNISGNKADMYYGVNMYDTIQLDGQGGATHALTVYSTWDPPVIANGYDANAVYNVLYDANSAEYNGLFLQQYDRFYLAQSAVTDPASGFAVSGLVNDYRTTTQSDEAGRAMYGSIFMLTGNAADQPVTWNVPVIQMSWQAPNVYTPGGVYRLHLERQSGLAETVHLTIMPPPGCSGPNFPYHYNGPLTSDIVIAVPTTTCQAKG